MVAPLEVCDHCTLQQLMAGAHYGRASSACKLKQETRICWDYYYVWYGITKNESWDNSINTHEQTSFQGMSFVWLFLRYIKCLSNRKGVRPPQNNTSSSSPLHLICHEERTHCILFDMSPIKMQTEYPLLTPSNHLASRDSFPADLLQLGCIGW